MKLIAIVAILFSFWTTSAIAAPTYEVAGVSMDDVLNIRAAPRATAPKVGEYGPRDSGIRIYRREGNWALTGRDDPGRPDGWVNLRYLRPATVVALPLSCAGTEPFWSLKINSPRRATYADPEIPSRRYVVEGFRRVGSGAAMRLVAGGRVAIAAGACSDGMSDTSYPFSARVRLPGGRALTGCCE